MSECNKPGCMVAHGDPDPVTQERMRVSGIIDALVAAEAKASSEREALRSALSASAAREASLRGLLRECRRVLAWHAENSPETADEILGRRIDAALSEGGG